jgi:hypothetical protein
MAEVSVRTLVDHGNRHGSSYRKLEGDIYQAPERVAQSLTAQGIVEPVKEEAALEGLKKDELVAIAAAEGVELEPKDTKDKVVAKIAAARADASDGEA